MKSKEHLKYSNYDINSNIPTVALSGGIKTFATGLVVNYLPLYFVEMGGSPLALGAMTAIASIVGGFSSILGGLLADYYGRRKIVVLSAFYGVIFPILYTMILDWRYFAVIVGIAAFESISRPALRALIVDSISPERRTTTIAFLQVASSVPMALTPFIGGYLIQRDGLSYGFREASTLSAVAAVASTLIVYFFLKETLRKSKITCGSNHSKVHVSASDRRFSYRFLKSLRSLIVSYTLVAFANGAVSSYYILYASEVIGLTPMGWAPIASLQSLAVVLKIPGGWLSDRLGKKRAMMVSLLTCAPCTVLFTMSQSFLQVLAVSILLVVTGVYFGPAYEALQADLTPREIRGRAIAIWQSSAFVATACGTTVGGLLFQMIDPTLPFYLYTGIQLISALVLFIFVKEPAVKEV